MRRFALIGLLVMTSAVVAPAARASDDSLRQVPVGGTFQTSPEGAEALLTMLQDGFGAKVRRVGADEVYIEGPDE